MDPITAAFLTREIFGNVADTWKCVFYVLAFVMLGVFCWGILRRARLWRLGKPSPAAIEWKSVPGNLLRYVVLQQRVRGRGLASFAHALLFGGFGILFIGTLLIAVEHVVASMLGRQADDPVFHKGIYFAAYEVILDTAGLAMLAGCALFCYRGLKRPREFRHGIGDWCLLGLFATIGFTGYLVEGLRIIREQTPLPGFSYVGYALAIIFETLGFTQQSASTGHFVLWWLHSLLSLALVALFPWTRLLHVLAGFFRLAMGIEKLGSVRPVDLHEIEATGEIGAAYIEHFSRKQLLELDACVSCGRCEAVCPAFEAGKPLSPLGVVQDIRQHLRFREGSSISSGDTDPTVSRAALPGNAIAEETIWSCTACMACVDICPLAVDPLGFIVDMRRYLIADSRLRGAPAVALERTARRGNPWGMSGQDRFAWAEGLDVPTVATNPEFDVLYWVGCAAAFDPRLQRVARSIVKLFIHARVNFAVLGSDERCTGETARRMGDEMLFQQLASENIASFDRIGILQGQKRIVSHCPHCVNSLRLDYAQLGSRLEVVHHTEFLAELVETGRLVTPTAADTPNAVTYHDPCYLARAWDITEAPRKLLQQSVGEQALTEMPRRREHTACCGAGGGRMWFDDGIENRIGRSRIDEARRVGAHTLAVACPFCLVMTSDGMAAQGGTMAVRDVAEILADAIWTERSAH